MNLSLLNPPLNTSTFPISLHHPFFYLPYFPIPFPPFYPLWPYIALSYPNSTFPPTLLYPTLPPTFLSYPLLSFPLTFFPLQYSFLFYYLYSFLPYLPFLLPFPILPFRKTIFYLTPPPPSIHSPVFSPPFRTHLSNTLPYTFISYPSVHLYLMYSLYSDLFFTPSLLHTLNIFFSYPLPFLPFFLPNLS